MMRQISDERIEHLSCEAVTQPWLRVSGDQVRAIIDRLRAAEAERDELKARLKHDYEEHEQSDLEMIRERDRLEEVADALAYAIGTEEEIGEHSNLNNPWENALELVAQIQAERDAYKAKLEQVRQWAASYEGEEYGQIADLNEILAEPQPEVTPTAAETTPDSPSLPADRSGQPS